MYLKFYTCTYFLCYHQSPLLQVPGLSHKELSFPCFILTDTPLISVYYVSHLPLSASLLNLLRAVYIDLDNPDVSSFRPLKYYLALRLLAPHRQAFRVYLIACLTATCRQYKVSVGHTASFRTMPPANTLVRRVNWNAFAPIVRARPCPVFGRPVHHRNCFHRLRPGTSPQALQTLPLGRRPAL